MEKRKLIFAFIILAVLTVGWALFRPERLFVNAKVNEAMPTAGQMGPDTGDTVLATGNFHDVAHKGIGAATRDVQRAVRLRQRLRIVACSDLDSIEIERVLGTMAHERHVIPSASR